MKIITIPIAVLVASVFVPVEKSAEVMIGNIDNANLVAENLLTKDKNHYGSFVFKQTYQSRQRSALTALSEEDYDELKAISEGNKVLVKTQGAKTFVKTIQYNRTVKEIDKEAYGHVNKILKKYE